MARDAAVRERHPCRFRADSRRIFKLAGACSAFMVVRDEALRLPTSSTHRTLGVDRFYVVDNGSTDGTLELLLDPPDCYLFRTDDPFGAANFAGLVMPSRGIRDWLLVPRHRPDELLVYPHSESVRRRSSVHSSTG